MEVKHYDGGGIREVPLGKGVFTDMSMVGLTRLSQRYEYGRVKYGASDNYKRGLPISGCVNSAFRHLIAYLAGDNSEDHLAACVWNCFAIMELETNNPKWQDIKVRKKYKGDDLKYTGYTQGREFIK